MAPLPSWTEQEDKVLRAMADQGATSREIGAAMGKTRNAIIGRSHRLGIKLGLKRPPGPKPKPKQPRIRRPVPSKIIVAPAPKPVPASPAPAPDPVVVALPVFSPAPSRVTFMNRRPFQCAFMLGSGYKSPICAQPIAHEFTSYCAEHHALTHVPYQGKALKAVSDPAVIKKERKERAEPEVAELAFDEPAELESAIFFA